jgi:TetR/AcrR family transcriptional regulator, fatty acid metabolism regulator protein
MVKKKLGSRKNQAMATRQKVYKATITLFKQKGYEHVTVSDICKKAGVSIGTFYLYFKSKDEASRYLFDTAAKTFDEYVEKELSRCDSAIEKLAIVCKKMIEHNQSMGIENYRLIYSTLLNANNKTFPSTLVKWAHYPVFLKLIEEGQAKGEIRNDLSSDDIAHIIYHCGRGITYNWCLIGDKFDLVKENEKFITLIARGLRPA